MERISVTRAPRSDRDFPSHDALGGRILIPAALERRARERDSESIPARRTDAMEPAGGAGWLSPVDCNSLRVACT